MNKYLPGQAPRVTMEQIEALIQREDYFTAAEAIYGKPHRIGFERIDGKYQPVYDNEIHRAHCHTTICTVILKNGITLVGVNTGSVYPENYDPAMAKEMARRDAINKAWPMLGYELATKRMGEGE